MNSPAFCLVPSFIAATRISGLVRPILPLALLSLLCLMTISAIRSSAIAEMKLDDFFWFVIEGIWKMSLFDFLVIYIAVGFVINCAVLALLRCRGVRR